MYNTEAPPRSELPSSRALIKSTLIALAVALVLLVTVVLPAEYAIDPTRIGRVLGLTQMGEVKMALAKEAAAEEAAGATAAAPVCPPGVPEGVGCGEPSLRAARAGTYVLDPTHASVIARVVTPSGRSSSWK